MKRKIHTGYEIFEELNDKLIEEVKGNGTQYTEGVNRLVEYDRPADISIREIDIKCLDGTNTIALHLFEKWDMGEDVPLLIAIHGGGYRRKCGF